MPKAIRREPITVEVDGVSHTGERVIEGSRSLSQRVIYQGRTELDNTYYTPAEAAMMDGIAKAILIRLVKQGPLGAPSRARK
jgi:hypothetical protein